MDPDEFARRAEVLRAYLRLIAEAQLPPVLQSRLSASDLVQETLLQAQRKLDQFEGDPDVHLRAWLRKILARKILDALHRLPPEVAAADVQPSSLRVELWARVEEEPGRRLLEQEQLVQLAQALETLPPDQRRAVVLHHLQAVPVAEVARHMGRSEASVAGLLRRGLCHLRDRLAEAS